VEVKVPWGKLYDDPAGEKTNTLLAVRNRLFESTIEQLKELANT
jgi:hypothetical protein